MKPSYLIMKNGIYIAGFVSDYLELAHGVFDIICTACVIGDTCGLYYANGDPIVRFGKDGLEQR